MDEKLFLAKSDGTTLINHSKLVHENAKIIIDYFYPFLNGENYKEEKEEILLAALLHDIGKSTKSFQGFLTKNKKLKDKFPHQVIAWAIISLFLDKKNKDYILDLIFWHHGYSQLLDHSNIEILDTLNDEDIDRVISTMKNLLDNKFITDEPLEENISTPLYIDYESRYNLKNKIVFRNILILADRLTSKYNRILDETILETINRKTIIEEFNLLPNVDESRLNKQKTIIETIDKENKNTTFLNASAGFGKTMLGLLWCLPKKEKLIWVAPRNGVVESLYYSITNDLELLGIKDKIKVQSYYNSKVVNGGGDFLDADIIITNIDTFLNQSLNNSKLINLTLINTCNVVFDEWHEFVGDSPIFPYFNTMLQIRNTLTKAKTLLLTATPIDIDSLISSRFNKNEECKILHLPAKYKHFDAQHNKKYNINVVEKPIINKNTLTVFNTIKTTQDEFLNGGYDNIIHSNYTDEDKKNRINLVLNLHGKNKPKEKSLASSLITQASMDISFTHLNDVILTPQTTLQRIGRCNRWGELEEATINFIPTLKNKEYGRRGDSTIIKNLYDEDLHNKWVTELKNIDNKKLNLDELYVIYNNFAEKNSKEITKYCEILNNKNQKQLKSFFLKRTHNYVLTDTEIKHISKVNKLRNKFDSLFYICEKTNGGWSDVLQYTPTYLVDISEKFKENEYKLSTNLPKIVYSLITKHKGYEIFNNHFKPTVDRLRNKSLSSDSPYIRLDVEYDNNLGVLNK